MCEACMENDEGTYSLADTRGPIGTLGGLASDEDEPEDERIAQDLIRLFRENRAVRKAVLDVVMSCPNVKWEM